MIEYFYNIESFEAADGRFSARISLVKDNPIYRAHFPGHPITPGACQLEIVRAVASRAVGSPAAITSVKNLKYVEVVDPARTDAFTVEGQIAPDGELFKCTASVADGDTVFTKVSLYLKK